MRRVLFPIVLLLTGCAGMPARPPVADVAAAWAERQARLGQIETWNLHGRLALRTEERGGSASLFWIRTRDAHRLNLIGPFGGGRVRVIYDADTAELRDASGRIYRGSSVQDLLARVTGWQLPLAGLNYWILGLPAPAASVQSELDAWGRLKALEQLGWRIEYLDYMRVGPYELPQRIFIKRASADELVEARVAIEQWDVGPAAAH